MKTDPYKEHVTKISERWKESENLTSFQREMTDHIQKLGIIMTSEVSIVT